MNDGIKNYLTIFALITLFLSYLYLIFQKKIKKVFAVSTMSQVSYGLLIIIFSRDLFVYFFIYHMITKGIIFILIDKIFTEKNIIYIKNMKEKIIRYDTYLMIFILLFNLTGVYPSILYLLKKNIGYTLFLNSIIFLVGIFFGKIISNLNITEKAKKMNNIIIPLSSLLIIINLYLQSENIYESIIGFIFFIFGFVIYKIFKEESFEKDFSIFDFDKNLYYIYTFVLISMIFELKGMI
jgi:multicomponent Na+:H+ antiporter subunit D